MKALTSNSLNLSCHILHLSHYAVIPRRVCSEQSSRFRIGGLGSKTIEPRLSDSFPASEQGIFEIPTLSSPSIIGRRKNSERWLNERNQLAKDLNIRIRSFDYLTSLLATEVSRLAYVSTPVRKATFRLSNEIRWQPPSLRRTQIPIGESWFANSNTDAITYCRNTPRLSQPRGPTIHITQNSSRNTVLGKSSTVFRFWGSDESEASPTPIDTLVTISL